jgi:hypothetical protein
MAKWAAGEPDDLAWLDEWCAELREHVKAGRTVRRARIVSDPLSESPCVQWGFDERALDPQRADLVRQLRRMERIPTWSCVSKRH